MTGAENGRYVICVHVRHRAASVPFATTNVAVSGKVRWNGAVEDATGAIAAALDQPHGERVHAGARTAGKKASDGMRMA